MRRVGWLVFPLSFLVGLSVIAFSLVLSFRRPDWRLVVGLVLAAIGIAISAADFFWIAERISQRRENDRSAQVFSVGDSMAVVIMGGAANSP